MKPVTRKFRNPAYLLLLTVLAGAMILVPGGQSTRAQQNKPNQQGQSASSAQPQAPVGSGFTYQGRLKDGGNPANGQYDLQFSLYDAASGGTQVGSTATVANQTVTDGLFTVVLDFGTSAFGGQARWLEVAVRLAGVGSYTTLSPRQSLTAVPYAQSLATGSTGAVITGTLPGPALVVTNVQGVGVKGTGNVGVQAQGGTYGVSAQGGSYGLFGSGGSYGVYGTGGAAGIGVRGESDSSSGVVGISSSGYGVGGQSDSWHGVYGSSNSKHGGLFTNNSSTGYAALQAYANGTPGYGVYGEGNGVGVWGSSPNGTGTRGATTTGYGVLGISGGSGTGVRGESPGGNGVYGLSTSGTSMGVYGENTSTTGYGVYGVNNANNAQARGVVGQSNVGYGVAGASDTGVAVWGQSNSGYGVTGQSTTGIGIYGSSSGANGTGVWGYSNASGSTGVRGQGVTIGVRGEGNSGVRGDGSVHGLVGSGGIYGIRAGAPSPGWAGWFDGEVEVTGPCCAAAEGTFKIDHPLDPENKYLVQSAVQSADMISTYSGNVTTDAKGEAVVSVPSYVEALNKDFRYQLTILGEQFAQARVSSELRNSRFTIKTDKPNIKVSWQLTGVRQDPYAKAHPIQVEIEKSQEERGKYRHPVEWGQPESKGTEYEKIEQMKTSPEVSKLNPIPPGR